MNGGKKFDQIRINSEFDREKGNNSNSSITTIFQKIAQSNLNPITYIGVYNFYVKVENIHTTI